MKKLSFSYELLIDFDEPVTKHSFTVKCRPMRDERQEIEREELYIYPNEFLCEGTDSFGNSYVYGNTEKTHSAFRILLKGVAVTGLRDRVPALPNHRIGFYGKETAYTTADEDMRSFFNSIDFSDCEDEYKKSEKIMNIISDALMYVQGVTDIRTTAAEAWKRKQGVCQDYAHIMLTFCRLAGIKCRYVTGMLIGEGASHAWVEIACKGAWWGFDPTNKTIVTDEHIKISHGRDYSDCLINQGVFMGRAKQLQSVNVNVKEVGE